jgi:hypothetical protein
VEFVAEEHSTKGWQSRTTRDIQIEIARRIRTMIAESYIARLLL